VSVEPFLGDLGDCSPHPLRRLHPQTKCGESQPSSSGHKNFDVASEIVLALIDLFCIVRNGSMILGDFMQNTKSL
jgi:hypothetical protein